MSGRTASHYLVLAKLVGAGRGVVYKAEDTALRRCQDEKPYTFTAFDPLKGRGRVLKTIERGPSGDCYGSLSPDGSTFEISKDDEPEIHNRLLPLDGGSLCDITRFARNDIL